MTIVRSYHIRRRRVSAFDAAAPAGERVGLPYAEASSPAETYADASRLAQTYPVRPLPHQDVADKLLIDTRWQEICEEISMHGALDRHYLD